MAIRIRVIDGHRVALCAAETKPELGDLYLDDGMHEALDEKFHADYVKMGFIKEESKIDELVEKLKFFMAEKDLIIKDVAGLIERNPATVWAFLRKKVKPQDRTIYRIKKLVMRRK